jgi:hypothetical protein
MSAEAKVVDNYVSALHMLGTHKRTACSSVVLVDYLRMLLAETDDSGGENRRTTTGGRRLGWTTVGGAPRLTDGAMQSRR